MKKIIILGLIFIISPFFMFAHNPLSSTYSLEIGDKISVLTISLSQVGVNQAMSKKLNGLQVEDYKAYKELIVKYVKSNCFLKIDGDKIEIKEGGIKLGNHQTDLKFVLPSFSKTAKNLIIDIPAFHENGEHQTIFFVNFYGKKNKIILSEKNNYQGEIKLSEENLYVYWLWFVVYASIVLIVINFYVKKVKKK